jgi:phosphoribosyl 1,2-cyclic phosphodiesterase
VEAGADRVLIDAGLGPRSLAERLLSAGVDPASLRAVLISHEHSDHAAGAASFSAKWGVPLAGTRGTYAAAGFGSVTIASYQVLREGVACRFGGLEVQCLGIPHDAAEPLAFVLSAGNASFGHATDLGHVSPAFVSAFRKCQAVLIESNYDPGLLRDGPYPWSLKERILSPRGHLSNEDVSRFLGEIPEACHTVVLAHLSRTNNHPELALMAAERALNVAGRSDVRIELTGPEGTSWVQVHSRSRQLSLF